MCDSEQPFYRSAKLIATIVLALVLASAAIAQTVQLTFDRLPSAQGWTYFSYGVPESRSFSVDGTALHQNTMGTLLGRGGTSAEYYVLNNVVDRTKPFVLEVRARILNSERLDSGGFAFGVILPDQAFGIFIDKTGIQHEDDFSKYIAAGTDTTVFHDYRFEGTPYLEYRFFVDGVLAATGKPRFENFQGLNNIFVGDATSGGNAQADVTFFRFTELVPTLGTVPNHGGNAGSVTVQVYGSGFQTGTTVALTGLGPDIAGTNTAVANASFLTTTFNLVGAAPGVRTVAITNPGGSPVSIPNGFTVEQGGTPDLWVQIVGRRVFRIGGGEQTSYVTYGNRGAVDSGPAVVSISLPKSITYTLGFPNTENQIVSTGNTKTEAFIAVAVQSIAAGSTGVLPITLSTAAGQAAFAINTSVRRVR